MSLPAAPTAAEACTELGAAEAPRKRKWPLVIVVPLYCALVVAFFVTGWVIFAWPTSETAKVLALLVLLLMFLIVAAMLLAKWII